MERPSVLWTSKGRIYEYVTLGIVRCCQNILTMEIRRLQKSDLLTRVLWMNNPAVYSTMHFALPITIEGTEKWFDDNVDNEKRADMVLIEGGEIVAFAGITNIDKTLRKGESYTFVNPEMQGKGIGTIARRLVLDFAFGELGLNKVFAYTNEDNVASCRLSEKLGFTLEGRFRQEYVNKNGELKDRLYYVLLKEEWLNKIK